MTATHQTTHKVAVAKFAALGETHRLAMVCHLLSVVEVSVTELHMAVASDITPSATTRHIRVLESAGIVSRRIDRQRRIISLVPGSLDDLCQWWADICREKSDA